MKDSTRGRRQRTVHNWKQARAVLERWRKDLKTLTIEFKQPRVIDLVPIDFVSGEPVERKGTPTQKFRGRLIYFTNDDVTIRRPLGAILVVDNYEIVAILGRKDADGTTLARLRLVFRGENKQS